ncbi:galactosylgalactosylxylosylprotein 3-beta-glucuronosyltransferase 1-like isoform X2 [Gordionus sp. m RMFG-2023]|uniref:galactosylgalactosylxylosylprotein 3-beta-glucuronosyltransferase 1-like isoform X2 n=1 Tax=Gordionus sp. m RMFG-2023 TaxID=3053472 RepID=UPI0031FBF29F
MGLKELPVYTLLLAFILIYNYLIIQIYKSTNQIKALDDIGINPSLPVIYIITPTVNNLAQRAHLTRMAYTLALVPNVMWIVVEDADEPSPKVLRVLTNSWHPYVHLWIHKEYKNKHHKGCAQRNLGLAWLRNLFGVGQLSTLSTNSYLKSETMNDFQASRPSYAQLASKFENKYHKSINPFNFKNSKFLTNTASWRDNWSNKNGIVYFADDDNTYDIEIFYQMRQIKKVGVWPVAFSGGLNVERPLVIKGKVTGWLVAYVKQRPMATDMAGFAINLALVLQNADVYFHESYKNNWLESNFLSKFVDLQDLEPLANNCTQLFFKGIGMAHENTSPKS